jgi:hypothetical protein
MKLRNKKTGKIWHMPRLRQPTVQEDDISFFACIGEHGCSRCELFSYKSLAELNEEWEDYKPAEPLIKDEKVRKAVRVWAEVNDVSRVSCDSCIAHKKYMFRFSATELFNEPIIELYSASEESLWDDEHYTIAELCGEEEE